MKPCSVGYFARLRELWAHIFGIQIQMEMERLLMTSHHVWCYPEFLWSAYCWKTSKDCQERTSTTMDFVSVNHLTVSLPAQLLLELQRLLHSRIAILKLSVHQTANSCTAVEVPYFTAILSHQFLKLPAAPCVRRYQRVQIIEWERLPEGIATLIMIILQSWLCQKEHATCCCMWKSIRSHLKNCRWMVQLWKEIHFPQRGHRAEA